jgi:hypothetical protein
LVKDGQAPFEMTKKVRITAMGVLRRVFNGYGRDFAARR